MRETLALAGLCLFVAAASLAVILWTVISAAVEGVLVGEVLTLDGLLLISVGLLISAMFGFCFLWLARDAHLWEMLRSRKVAVSDGEKPPGEP